VILFHVCGNELWASKKTQRVSLSPGNLPGLKELNFWALSIARPSNDHNVSKTGSVSVSREVVGGIESVRSVREN
jgi:hypothetical protein